jgi:hypothetical protein
MRLLLLLLLLLLQRRVILKACNIRQHYILKLELVFPNVRCLTRATVWERHAYVFTAALYLNGWFRPRKRLAVVVPYIILTL